MEEVTKRPVRRFPWLLGGGLVIMWLVLNATQTPGAIALGVIVAVAMVRAGAMLRPDLPKLRRPDLAASLFLLVAADIARSNLAVALIVLSGGRRIRSGFVKIPLELRDPHGLAVLAGIVTCTPGTVWVDLSADGRTLTLHVLDLVDESHWIEWIKGRYERRLFGIFE
jgi:multicomponent K+:H+ antiporter subunit E